jgi:hypothetical protein
MLVALITDEASATVLNLQLFAEHRARADFFVQNRQILMGWSRLVAGTRFALYLSQFCVDFSNSFFNRFPLKFCID